MLSAKKSKPKEKHHESRSYITFPEIIEIINEIQKKPEALLEMIGLDLQQTVGEYLLAILNAEITHFFWGENFINTATKAQTTATALMIENLP